MRAAVILGLGCSEKDLKPFQQGSQVSWTMGLPANSSDADAILVFGGDGTIHRLLAQLVRLQLPVLVVPCGSGNDFARALQVRSTRDALTAWRNFLAGADNAKKIDLGVISPFDVPAPHQYYFCCVGGVGLDAETARRANRLPRWLRGHGGYALSLPGALVQFAAQRMKISRPKSDRPEQLVVYSDQPAYVAAFANAPVYGGGMKIAPRALMDDGQLDICIVRDIDKLKLFCLFPTIYFGRHLDIPQVDYFQAQGLRIETEVPMDVYADGEYVCRTPIDVSVVPAILKVIVPGSTRFREAAKKQVE
jgi:diacylglycerol kinase (ATP)